jgi:dTDP-4-dehydrorhamnose 3,5-epimerase-like enzyme
MVNEVSITEFSNCGNARGMSLPVPEEAQACLGKVADVHLASSKPRSVRGNHYHLRPSEAIVVVPGSRWSLHWGDGETTTVHNSPCTTECSTERPQYR